MNNIEVVANRNQSKSKHNVSYFMKIPNTNLVILYRLSMNSNRHYYSYIVVLSNSVLSVIKRADKMKEIDRHLHGICYEIYNSYTYEPGEGVIDWFPSARTMYEHLVKRHCEKHADVIEYCLEIQKYIRNNFYEFKRLQSFVDDMEAKYSMDYFNNHIVTKKLNKDNILAAFDQTINSINELYNTPMGNYMHEEINMLKIKVQNQKTVCKKTNCKDCRYNKNWECSLLNPQNKNGNQF